MFQSFKKKGAMPADVRMFIQKDLNHEGPVGHEEKRYLKVFVRFAHFIVFCYSRTSW